MADVTITAANVLASSSAVLSKEYNAGATITRGQSVYLDTSTSTWKLTDSNAAATGNGINDTRGIAYGDVASGQPLTVILRDPGLTLGGTLVKGTSYYASATAGGVAPSADVTTGWYRVFLGIAISTTVLNYNPVASGATD